METIEIAVTEVNADGSETKSTMTATVIESAEQIAALFDAAAAKSAPVTKLESETCSRCAGSGKYSYCHMYGDRCFKCSGKGIYLTKRGEAASKYLTELRSKPASALKIGDQIRVTVYGVTGASGIEWATVTDVSGFWPDLTITTDKITMHGTPVAKMMRVMQTPEQAAETFAKALAFQSSLTKAGKPRKGAK